MDIDYVFPYVNNNDPKWREIAEKYYPGSKRQPQRYRELGFFKYLLRGISENMPWINSIIMLVDFESQVPEWLNTDTNIRIVTLDEFVPSEFLPTFNSNTIEMFLADIPGLSEGVIYGNDDFIPLSAISEVDYFNDDGCPKISYSIKYRLNNSFRRQCKRNWDVVARHLNNLSIGKGKFCEQSHEPQAITLSLLKQASIITENDRLSSITTIRDFKRKNLSQYIYFDYAIATNACIKRKSYYAFKELTRQNLGDIIDIITNKKKKWICLNDSEKTQMDIIGDIIKALDTIYPQKCKYEK